MKHRYQSPEGEGGAASGGAAPKTYTQAELDSVVAGLKNNTQEALAEKKAAQAKLKEFDGIDPAAARQVLDMFNNNAELKLIQEGKIDEVFQTRTAKLQDAHKRDLDAKDADVKAAQLRSEKFSRRVLNDALRSAAIETGVHKHAMDDVLLSGGQVFQLDEEGRAVQMADGKPVLGKDGKTPFGPAEWLASITEAKPHWFPASSSGAPASGQPGRGSTGQKTMKRSAFMTLTPKQQSETIKTTQVID